MTNYEACRKGGLARVKSKCRKCGQFLKNSDLIYSDYNIHAQCRMKEAWGQLAAIMSKGEADSPKYAFLSAFSLNPQIRDFKTGDVWEEGKKEKDAVRKYAEERDWKERKLLDKTFAKGFDRGALVGIVATVAVWLVLKFLGVL